MAGMARSARYRRDPGRGRSFRQRRCGRHRWIAGRGDAGAPVPQRPLCRTGADQPQRDCHPPRRKPGLRLAGQRLVRHLGRADQQRAGVARKCHLPERRGPWLEARPPQRRTEPEQRGGHRRGFVGSDSAFSGESAEGPPNFAGLDPNRRYLYAIARDGTLRVIQVANPAPRRSARPTPIRCTSRPASRRPAPASPSTRPTAARTASARGFTSRRCWSTWPLRISRTLRPTPASNGQRGLRLGDHRRRDRLPGEHQSHLCAPTLRWYPS